MTRFRELRQKKGLSQAEVAKAVNVVQTSVSKWECGNAFPDMEIALRVADFFGVSVDYLLGRDRQKKEPATGEGDGQKNPLVVELEKLIEDFDEAKLKLLLERAQLLDRMHISEDR